MEGLDGHGSDFRDSGGHGGVGEALARSLRRAGMPADRAEELGTVLVLNVEGALLLSRITRTLRPLELAADSTAALVAAELPK